MANFSEQLFEIIYFDVVIESAVVYDCLGTVLNGLPDHALVIRSGFIVFIGHQNWLRWPENWHSHSITRINAHGNAVMPGLIDAHTHLIFAGNRLNEFVMKSQGATYQSIAASGGGIWSTVLETRHATHADLLSSAAVKIDVMRHRGVTSVEIKSGYGLNYEAERKMLCVARDLASKSGIDIVTTFLGAHIVPKDWSGTHDEYVSEVIDWMKRLHDESLCDGVDVFIENNCFKIEDARRIANAASSLDLPIRLHVDQLTSGKGAEFAASVLALSADHLEHMSVEAAESLAASDTVATLLPYATLLVGKGAKPNIQALRAAGVKMAVSTDYNPGSAPIIDLLAAGLLAIGYFGMSVDEVVLGITRYAAQAIGLKKTHGALFVGAVGDVLVLESSHPAALFYNLGLNPIRHVIKRGQIIDSHI